MITTPVIPDGPVPPSRRNPQMMLIYGPPKVGKTHSVAALADTLILELERGGADHFAARKMDVPSMQALLDILATLTRLRKEGKPAAKRLAIDTIDVVEDWCYPAALDEYKSSVLGKTFEGSHILDLPQGAGYFRLREKFGEMLWLFGEAAEEVLLIGHIRDRLLTTVRGEVMSQDVALTGKIRAIACSRCSAIGMMRRDFNDHLVLTFKTSDAVNCGSRCEHLRGRDFVIGKVGSGGAPVFDWSAIYVKDEPVPAPAGEQKGT
jgi:AAA domain